MFNLKSIILLVLYTSQLTVMILNIHQNIQLIKSRYLLSSDSPKCLSSAVKLAGSIYLIMKLIHSSFSLRATRHFGISQPVPLINATVFFGKMQILYCIYKEFEFTNHSGTQNLKSHLAPYIFINKYRQRFVFS